MIRGAIFDADGVLLDSLGIWKELPSKYLENHGISAEPELSDILFSMSMEQGADYLKSQYDLRETCEEIIENLQEMLRDFYFFETKTKDGVKDVLKFLSDNDISMVVATSSPKELIKKALERNEILQYFEKILTTFEQGVSKHSPLIFNRAAEYLGTVAEETLVFEDSLYALKTAVDAGFYGVGVFDIHGEKNQKELKKCSNLYLKDIKDILEIVPILSV